MNETIYEKDRYIFRFDHRLIYNELQHTGCQFAGETEVDGYSFEHSGAEINGKFAGLPIDEINEPEKTEERVKAWTEKIKKLQ